MGQRIIQRIHGCSQCDKIPEDGEYMWYMGDEIWCEECCNKEEEDVSNGCEYYINKDRLNKWRENILK